MASFRVGERIRVAAPFDPPQEGATGRVDDVISVDIGNGRLAYDAARQEEHPPQNERLVESVGNAGRHIQDALLFHSRCPLGFMK
jgi:hypothetical protein